MQSSSTTTAKIGPVAFLGSGGAEIGTGASLSTGVGFGQEAFPDSGFGPIPFPTGDPS